jgi:membrane-bound lytic murein transglycosylase A
MNASFSYAHTKRKPAARRRGLLAALLFTFVRVASAPAEPILGDDLGRESLKRALFQSLAYLEKLPAPQVIGRAPRPFTAAETIASLRAFDDTLDRWDCRRCWLGEVSRLFDLVPSSGAADLQPVLFTGYYQPVLEASLTPAPDYRFPIYGKPADLITADAAPGAAEGRVIARLQGDRRVPYYSRAEIDQGGALRGRGYEIAWAKDPVDVFFLHIQGSGILQLPDGRRLHVGYAAQNGLPYRSVGRLLIDRGEIPPEEMSMQRLRGFLANHPAERDRIMAHNESYVFFRFLDSGPLGSLEVPVTAGRSIATDSRIFPKGALAFMYSERPVLDRAGRLRGWTPFLRFVFNQDTGGAIRGPQRADLFFGATAEAAAAAGYMNSRGKLYFLTAKHRPADPLPENRGSSAVRQKR